MSGYTCVGSVRGACGRVHSTRGGYTDRAVIDGENYTYSQRCQVGAEIMAKLKAVERSSS